MTGDTVRMVVSGDPETIRILCEELTSRLLGQPSIVPPADTDQCVTCGAAFEVSAAAGAMRCPECVAGGWFPEGGARKKTLSAAELDALSPAMTVTAGAFADGRRTERVRWVKLHSGRWQTAQRESVDNNAGVSSIWLAANRRPTLPEETV